MVLPEPFTTASPVLVSFDWTDVAAGTGINTYYGINSTKSTGVFDYRLNENAVHSHSVATEGTVQENGISLELDFDLTEFKVTKTLKGLAFVWVPWKIDFTSGGGETAYIYITAKLRKWDGTTETEIASESTSLTQTFSDASDPFYIDSTIGITVPETIFRVGETLRLTIIATVDASGAGSAGTAKVTLYHDPQNAAVATFDYTNLKLDVPSKLDL